MRAGPPSWNGIAHVKVKGRNGFDWTPGTWLSIHVPVDPIEIGKPCRFQEIVLVLKGNKWHRRKHKKPTPPFLVDSISMRSDGSFDVKVSKIPK